MNYQKIYSQLIHKRKHEHVLAKLDKTDPDYVYVEEHHIVPRCIGGSNDKSNLVNLTGREHFIAHRLLTKLYPSNYKINLAVIMMCMNTQLKARCRVTSAEYQRLKEICQCNQLKLWNGMSKEQKDTVVSRLVRGVKDYWKNLSPEQRKQISAEQSVRSKKQMLSRTPEQVKQFGQQHSQTLKNMSEEKKAEIRAKKQKTWKEKMANMPPKPPPKKMSKAERLKFNKEHGAKLHQHFREWRASLSEEDKVKLRQTQSKRFSEFKKQKNEFNKFRETLRHKTKEYQENATEEQKKARGSAISAAKKSIAFTEEQYDIIRKYPLRKAAQMIGCTVKVIQRGRRELGIEKHRHKPKN